MRLDYKRKSTPIYDSFVDTVYPIPSERATELGVREIEEKLKTNITTGLSTQEVQKRIEIHGLNEMHDDEEESLFMKYLEKFKDPMILLLLGSACISILMRQWDDAISIAVAVLIVCSVAFVQEYRSEQAIAKLKQLVTHKCTVLRDGITCRIQANQVAIGDIILFNVGDRIPADARIVESNQLSTNEAALTGESKPVYKSTNSLIINEHEEEILSSRKNIVFMGTLVTTGNGKAIVTAIGESTELGKVSKILKQVEDKKTPLQISMDNLGKHLTIISFAVIAIIFIIGVLHGNKLLDQFTLAVSLAVAAIPEGLPVVVTVTLAMGVIRMARKNAIVRKLPSVESLGACDVICVDKTGTLTQNQMTLTTLYTVNDNSFTDVSGTGYSFEGNFSKIRNTINVREHDNLRLLLEIGNLCNNAQFVENEMIGNPTEGALLVALAKAGFHDARRDWERLEEIPFSSETKWMGVKCQHNQTKETLYFVKGALEQILEMSKFYYVSKNQSNALTKTIIDQITSASQKLENNALRVVALAYGRDLKSLTFVGLVGIIDPPRPGVYESIRKLKNSGVKIIMITGDSKSTAISIAEQLGICNGNDSMALSTKDLKDPNFSRTIENACVFYRMAPVHKMKIVETLQNNGHIVAMTGDGVNDAPALKLADIGIAMGKVGSDVCKEAADMILVDDNFSTIEVAIEESKSVFQGVKNFVRFQLTTSIAALSLIAFCNLLGLPLPLNPMQILYINIIMDGPPAQSLGIEPVDEDIMKLPPRDPAKPVISKDMILRILTSALIMVIGTFFVFVKEMNHDYMVTSRDTTMTFTTFIMLQMFNALNCRNDQKSIFKIGLFKNMAFIYSVGICIIGTLLLIYVPFLQKIFDTEAISFWDIILILCISSTVLICEELIKYFGKNKRNVRNLEQVYII